MIRGSFFEELDADVCGDFFDHIDDLLDFPNEDECPITGEGENPNLGGLWSTAHEDLKVSESAFSSGQGSSLTSEDDLAAGLSVPCEDLDQLEWLSTFVEDSFSAGIITLEEEGNNKDSQFRTSSPVSVLEGSSCTEKTLPLSPDTVVPGRARTKRPRPASFNTRLPVALISATSSTDTHTGPPLLSASDFPPELDDFAESRPHENFPKKKKKRPAPAAHQGVAHDRWAPPAHPVRKCMHCEIQKTPQWRAGPMGPKTLCNACGVRYKSGRLFPEYRPAASPTFISAVHSNSHKKVVEMRVKMGQKEPAPTPQFVRKSGGRSSGNQLLLDHNE